MIDATGSGLSMAAGIVGRVRPVRSTRTVGRPRVPGPDEEALARDLVDEGREHHLAGRFDEAEQRYRAALAEYPGFGPATAALGALLLHQNRYRHAYSYLRRAVHLAPAMAETNHAFAQALRGIGEFQEAESYLFRALRLSPDDPQIRIDLVELNLALGRTHEALRHYDHVKRHPVVRAKLPALPDRRWRGEPLGQRRLLVGSEGEGLGDAIIWARYLPLLPTGDADIRLEIQRPLVRLWRSSFPGLEVIESPALPDDLLWTLRPVPDHDVWTDPTGVALMLGPDGPLASPPGGYLHPDAAIVERWRDRLRLRPDVLNVGIVWQTNETPGRAVNTPGWQSHLRNVPLAALAPLAAAPGVRWLSLQKGPAEDEPAPEGWETERRGPELDDMAETAAVISLLDVTIGCDTSVTNLAGAMGRPCWVLLPVMPDARWTYSGERTPWYVGARLFRQERQGDWAPAIERVAEELTRLVRISPGGQHP